MKLFDTKSKRTAGESLPVLAFCCFFAHSLATGQSTAPKPARVVTEYALTSAQDFSNPDPGAWHLLASNDDGRSWTVLDIQTNQAFNARSQRRLFSIRNQSAYSTYRLQVDTAADVALAELELIGPVAGATNQVDLQAIVSASGEHPLIGPATQAFDGIRPPSGLISALASPRSAGFNANILSGTRW